MAHLAPFLIYILLLVFFRALGGRLPAHTLSAVEKAGRFVWMALLTHTAVYLLVVMRSLYRLRATLKSRYSRIETIDLSWLRYMAFAFFATYLVLAVLLLFLSHDHPLLSEDKTVSLVLSILVYALGWRGLFQGSAPLGALERAGAAVKYARSGASADEAIRLLESVRRLMDEEKPYLDPDLSLPALAEEAGLSTGVLSRVINEAAGANFYDFVNAYRVKKAARLLADPVHAGRSILDIAFGVGFRSKSTFNTCFKKATGLTPKELRARGSSA
jgi:AraC-like DNA-binding protein